MANVTIIAFGTRGDVQPVILSVDDEPQVLNAIERDLRQHYQRDYRILTVGSGEEGLQTVHKLKQRHDPLALFLVKDFLSRNRIPYRWLDIESDSEVATTIGEQAQLPVVFFPDGRYAEAPDNRQLAELCGLQTDASEPFYDLLIVGAGPAGQGATTTHKVEVIRLFEAGFLEPEICERLSMPHDLRSVENYVQTYKNVLKLLDNGFSPSEISGILSINKRLVETYAQIVGEHHPDVVAGHTLPQDENNGDPQNR